MSNSRFQQFFCAILESQTGHNYKHNTFKRNYAKLSCHNRVLIKGRRSVVCQALNCYCLQDCRLKRPFLHVDKIARLKQKPQYVTIRIYVQLVK